MEIKSEPFLCVECARTFSHSGSLSMHVIRDHGEKKFLCGECTEAFVFNSDLVRHTERKHVLERERPYMCDTCGKSFYQRCELVRHGDMHNNEKYFCTFCPKYFSYSSYLDTHTLVHTEEKPVCIDCNKTFSTASYLRSHRKRVHGINEPSKKTRRRRQVASYECTQCPFIGRQTRDLVRHDAKEHTIKPEVNSIELSCEFCKQVFPRRKYLNAHRRTIHRENLIKCQQCPMRFSKMKNLKKHLSNSCKLTKQIKIEETHSSGIFSSDTKEEVKIFVSVDAGEEVKGRDIVFSEEGLTKQEIIEQDTHAFSEVNTKEGIKEQDEEVSVEVNAIEEKDIVCEPKELDDHILPEISIKSTKEEVDNISSQVVKENVDPSISYDVLYEFLDLNSYATPKNDNK